jgi:sulfur carrier protein
MKLIVNNNLEELPENITLFQLLEERGWEHGRGIAVAINYQVISKSDWGHTSLRENDKLTIIRAVQGG